MASSADQSYQQWDYRCLTYTDSSLQTLRDKVTETAKELGQLINEHNRMHSVWSDRAGAPRPRSDEEDFEGRAGT